MNPGVIEKIWNVYFRERVHFTFTIQEKIRTLNLLTWQYRYLIGKYEKVAPYPNIVDFLDWAKGMLRDESVPEELSCQGLLSDNNMLIDAATQLETIAGAWFPDETTEKKLNYLRGLLSEAFS